MSSSANTDFYSLEVDRPKNRLRLTIRGFWRGPEDVPSYVADIRAAAAQLRPGFTLVADATLMQPHAQTVIAVHEEAQRALVAAGLDRTAEIIPSAIAQLQARRIAAASGMKKQVFTSLADAEAWLDAGPAPA